MLLSLFVSCKKDEETDADEGVTTEGAEETKNKYDVYDDLGDIDFEGRTITIASTNRSWYLDEVSVERFSGDIVNDSIFKRNQNVEERANIKIKNELLGSNQFAISTALQENIRSQMHQYDLVVAPVYATVQATNKGILHDLKKTSKVNLSKPYWSQLFNDTMSIGESQYIATGAISLSYYRFLYVTVVNDSVLESQSDVPNLIDMVNNKKWTLAAQKELAIRYYNDVGNNGQDDQDMYGFITTDYIGVDPYWSSCEISRLKKDASNYYVVDLNVDKLTYLFDTVKAMFSDPSTLCVAHDPSHETGCGELSEIYDMFSRGKSLMATIWLQGVESASIRNMSSEYTILPIPKYEESQDTYYSYLHDSFTGMAIPATAPLYDLDVFGAVMEAMASESYRTVTPAYYETALKAKYAGSPESVDMLEMITKNVYIDGGAMYTNQLDKMSQTFREIVSSHIKNGDMYDSVTKNISSSYTGTSYENAKNKFYEFQDEIKAMQKGQ